MTFLQNNVDYFAKITDYAGWAQFPGAQAFGNNSLGQLGLNTLTNVFSSPTTVAQTSWANWIDATYLRSGSALAMISANNQGFLTGQFALSSGVPAQVGTATSWTNASSGYDFVVAVQSNGTLWSWGINTQGRLGLNTSTASFNTPTQIGTQTYWTSVATGTNFAASIQSPGILWMWGNNSNGQLGQVNTTNRSSPVIVANYQNYTSIAMGSSPSGSGSAFWLGLQSPGTLWGCGYGTSGNLGNSSLTTFSSPIQIGTTSIWTSVSTGKSFALGIQAPGTLWAWGTGSPNNGQSGLNTTTTYSSPVQVGTLSSWTQVSCGYVNTLAIQSPGTLWAWGNSAYSQLGLNTTTNISSPVQVGVASNWISAASSNYFSVAIQSPGTLWTCGNNNFGQLGTSNTALLSTFNQIGAVTTWSKVALGNAQVLAIQTPGTLWAWGNNSFGQLGLGDQTHRSSPVQVGALSTWSQISCWGNSALALQNNGTLWAWGLNTYGQLGLNTTTNYSSPVQVGTLSNWTQIATGLWNKVALNANTIGNLWTWGGGATGALGNNTVTLNVSSPILIATATWNNRGWAQVACSQYAVVGLQSNGTLYWWGFNAGNQLSPVQIGSLSGFTQVTAGTGGHFMYVQSPGTLWGSGNNVYGQLGTNSTTSIPISSAVQVGAINYWTQVACGYNHTAAIQSPGTLWTWGQNSYGQLGTSNQTTYSSPVQVGALTYWTSVSCGQYHTVAVQSNGTLWAWGLNTYSQLGQSNQTLRSSPVQVGLASTWTTVFPASNAYTFSLAQQTPGTLFEWGINTYGQLGTGYSFTSTPVQRVTGYFKKVTTSYSNYYWQSVLDSTIVQAGAGDIPLIDPTNSIAWKSYDTGLYHFVGVQTNGTAWATGNNSYGQLGLGDQTYRSSIVQIGTGSNWVKVSCADYGSLLIDNSLNAWVFGNNNQYQLGLSDTTNRSSPVQITYATGIKNVSLDNSDIWLIDGNNNLWAGGIGNNNAFGSPGTVSFAANQYNPVQIQGILGWASVSDGNGHTLGIQSNGTLWAWGLNTAGELGLSDTTNRSSPSQVGALNTWTAVAAGFNYFTLALQTPGTLWAWGYNQYGQLGNGSTTSYQVSSPIQVGSSTTWTQISAGLNHAAAIQSNGALYTWGINSFGQLGLNISINSNAISTPVQVGALNVWRSVSAGQSHTVAIQSNGTLWIWGVGNALGNSINTQVSSPIQLGSALWKMASAGAIYTVAIQSNGTLWGWGFNNAGQSIANTNFPNFVYSPIQVGTLSSWTSVAAQESGYISMGVQSNGTLWVWGINSYGQFGNNSFSSQVAVPGPLQVGNLSNWSTVITVGFNSNFAIQNNGSLWAWGNNAYNQLGFSLWNFPYPLQKTTNNFWTAVSTNQDSTLLVDISNNVWGLGNNSLGQLGLNTRTGYQYSPVQVGLGSINNTVKVETKAYSSLILYK